MGGCYSSASNEVFKSPRHKLPKERQVERSSVRKNGKSVSSPYGVTNSADEEETLLRNKCVGTNCETDDKTVVPSDSGIESLAPNSLPEETECSTNTDSADGRMSETENKSEIPDWFNQPSDNYQNETTKESESNPIQNYCSCGPRQVGYTSVQNNTCKTHMNTCKTHMNSPKSYRNSDVTGLKSSFKDFMRKTEKRVRLSWKSSDSLDYNKQMTTHLDRTKSEQSEIFKDDISFCAPLAQFDSLGCNLDRQNSKNRISTLSTASEIEAVSRDICNCEFYANNLANELDSLVPEREDSLPKEGTEITESPTESVINHSETMLSSVTTNNDSEFKDDMDSSHGDIKSKISKENFVVKHVSLASLSSVRPSLSSLADVTMTTHEGREMVMIDVETYTQILEELSLLKAKLSQLTAIIQDDPLLDQAFQMMDACQLNFDNSLNYTDTDGQKEYAADLSS